MIDILIEKGADINVQTGNGQTCLHLAIILCYREREYSHSVESDPKVKYIDVSSKRQVIILLLSGVARIKNLFSLFFLVGAQIFLYPFDMIVSMIFVGTPKMCVCVCVWGGGGGVPPQILLWIYCLFFFFFFFFFL